MYSQLLINNSYYYCGDQEEKGACSRHASVCSVICLVMGFVAVFKLELAGCQACNCRLDSLFTSFVGHETKSQCCRVRVKEAVKISDSEGWGHFCHSRVIC